MYLLIDEHTSVGFKGGKPVSILWRAHFPPLPYKNLNWLKESAEGYLNGCCGFNCEIFNMTLSGTGVYVNVVADIRDGKRKSKKR